MTSKMLKFCKAYVENGGNPYDAARAVKYKTPHVSGYVNMKKSEVLQKIKELQAVNRDAFTEKFAGDCKKEAEAVAEVGLTREALMKRLWELAMLPPLGEHQNISGQVKAAAELAEIMSLKVKFTMDLSVFNGWTRDELDHYATTGEVPERIARVAEAGSQTIN